MTSPDPALPTSRRREVLREIGALLLITLGIAGLFVVAYQVDPLLYWALISGTCVLAGVRLGMTTTSEE